MRQLLRASERCKDLCDSCEDLQLTTASTTTIQSNDKDNNKKKQRKQKKKKMQGDQ